MISERHNVDRQVRDQTVLVEDRTGRAGRLDNDRIDGRRQIYSLGRVDAWMDV